MTRRTFLQKTGKLMLSLGLFAMLPTSWQRAMAQSRDLRFSPLARNRLPMLPFKP